MEQKKILWIIASVGVFLLVVMGAALIINRPTQGVEPSLASLQSNNDTWVMPPISEPPVHATDAFQTEGEFVDGVVTDTTVQDSTVGSMTTYSDNTNVSDKTESTTIDLNSLKEGVPKSSVTATNQAGAAAVASRTTISAKAPASEATKPISGTSKSAATKSSTSSSNKSQDQYWVQVASVTNKNNAENARAALAANKIESEIFTHKADDGRLYYRLRVGPYTTKTEAEYWKGRIALIDEFSSIDSFITNTAAKK
ncbi:MAG: SPOR domain-containing protein [Treponema sp.]|nr:SPOR domain-containing protein [Treponema sp.]